MSPGILLQPCLSSEAAHNIHEGYARESPSQDYEKQCQRVAQRIVATLVRFRIVNRGRERWFKIACYKIHQSENDHENQRTQSV